MTKHILRPDPVRVGYYNQEWTISSLDGYTNYSRCINEEISDGDRNYLHTDTPGTFTVEFDDYYGRAYLRPTRVVGVTVMATVRVASAAATRFKFRVRYLGTNYDSEEFETDSTTYVEKYKTYWQLPNGNAWNSSRLKDIEFGLVYVDGVELRCTKLELHVHTEVIPHYIVTPDEDDTTAQEWRLYPGTAPAYMSLGQFDGDQSYIYGNTLWKEYDTTTTENLNAIWGIDENFIYAVGDSGTIVKWSEGDWDPVLSGTDKNLYGVWLNGSDNIYAVGEGGTILHWDGAVWDDSGSSVTTSDLHAVWGASSTEVYAVGAGGVTLLYDGVSWAVMSPSPSITKDLNAIWGDGISTVFVVGDDGESALWDGASWTNYSLSTSKDAYAIWGIDSSNAYAVGEDGLTRRWNGATWVTTASSGTSVDLRGLWGDGTDLLAVGEGGLILQTQLPLPVSFTELTPDTEEDLNAIWADPAPVIQWMVVGAGGESRTHDDLEWYPLSRYGMTDVPLVTAPPNVDKVKVVCQVKNEGDTPATVATVLHKGTDFYGGYSTDGHTIDVVDYWQTITDDYISDPAKEWPCGGPNADPWVTSAALTFTDYTTTETPPKTLQANGSAFQTELVVGDTILVELAGGGGTVDERVVTNIIDDKTLEVDKEWSYEEAAVTLGLTKVMRLVLGAKHLGGDVRCTTVAGEIFLSDTPVKTYELLPNADGDYQDLTPSAGDAWECVDEDPPNYDTDYIYGVADNAGTPLYSSFVLSGFVAPPEETIAAIDFEIVGRLGKDNPAIIAPMLHEKKSGGPYLLTPRRINNTGSSWFTIKERLPVNPISGDPWVDFGGGIGNNHYGVALLEGDEVRITQVKVTAIMADTVQGGLPPDPLQLEITTEGYKLIDQGLLDGTIYAIQEFGVGTGGYDPIKPGVITPVNVGSLSLANEIYKAKIDNITQDTDTYPQKVQYWCKVPRGGAALGAIGELGLYAYVLWTPPASPYTVGQEVLFAIQHFPAQCRTKKTVHSFIVEIEYPAP